MYAEVPYTPNPVFYIFSVYCVSFTEMGCSHGNERAFDLLGEIGMRGSKLREDAGMIDSIEPGHDESLFASVGIKRVFTAVPSDGAFVFFLPLY